MKKFSEGLDTAVFTTKYVINEGSPILVVYHYEDGSWQFNGKEANLNDDDFKIVSLEEILQLDETLNELSDMGVGFVAERESINDKWEINPFEEN